MHKSKHTILLVDDTTQNLALLNTALKSLYSIKMAFSGVQALQIIEKAKPSLILLDVMMPDMDGYELCRQLKINPETRTIPIIFVTAKDNVDNEIFGLSLGAVDYIHKPININLLQARIKTHLPDFTAENNTKETDQVDHINELLDKELTTEDARLATINRLVRVAEYRDGDTSLHMHRVALYSRLLAQQMIDDEQFVEKIYKAAPMHDIGKIGIPDDILLRQGTLTREEFEIMKTHTEIGASIIETNQQGVLAVAYNIALTHHEKWDGSGYPAGLKGEEIPIEGRIVAIADVFDALTSVRSYKKSWSIEDAVELLLEQSNQHFEADMVHKFIAVLPQVIEIKEKFSDPDTVSD